MDARQNFFQEETIYQPQFYIDPLHGMIYTRQDLNQHLKREGMEALSQGERTMTSLEVIRFTMDSLSQAYSVADQPDKEAEIQALIAAIDR